MPERFVALSGRIPGYYYDDVNDFETVRMMLRVFTRISQLNRDTGRIKPFAYPSVALGFKYFESAYRSVDGRLKREDEHDPFRGRHFVAALDGDDPETIKFQNSWGEDWGDHGFGYIDENYFEAHMETAFVRWSCVCQWPSGTPHGRPRFLPTGGHLFSPLVATKLPTGQGC